MLNVKSALVFGLFCLLELGQGHAEDVDSTREFKISLPAPGEIKDSGPSPLKLVPDNQDVILVPGMTYEITVKSPPPPLPPRLCTDYWTAMYRTTQTRRGGFLRLQTITDVTDHRVNGSLRYPVSFRQAQTQGIGNIVAIPLSLMSGTSIDTTFFLYPGMPPITGKFKGTQMGRFAFSKDGTGGTVNLTRSNDVPDDLQRALRGQNDIREQPHFRNRAYHFSTPLPLLQVIISVKAR